MDIKTTYMGIELKNPIIIGASNLVTDIPMAQKLEEAGAAAIVYKSLFEEQIDLEAAELDEELHMYNERNAEMTSLFPDIQHSGPKSHLMALKKLKESVSIPVFASLNCVNDNSWIDYSQRLADTGINGLELNFYNTNIDPKLSSTEIENKRIEILKKIKSILTIPVSVKLTPFYTNTILTINSMDEVGSDGFVLFNKLFQPDIDIESEQMKLPYNLSSKGDNRLSLRYAGLLHSKVKGSICANTGIMDSGDLISMLLAGADAVQIVSTIYKNGATQITKMLEELSSFMKSKGYNSINDFKGKLSKVNIKEPFAYKRAQYVDYLMNSKKIIKNSPV